MNVGGKGLVCILLILFVLLLDSSSAIHRYVLTRKYYGEAIKLAQEKNKKLMVIGDPCSGNYFSFMPKLFSYYQHGDVTVDLFGCDKCHQLDINQNETWSKYGDNEYVVLDSATLSFSEDINKVLAHIKRVSGGDFYSSGGTTSLGWKYLFHTLYSLNYPNSTNYMIYPYQPGDTHYRAYHFKTKKNVSYTF